METLVEFFYPYRVILGFIFTLIDIALQFSPLTKQFGELAGNLALALACWVALSALALIWDKWEPQKYGWTVSIAKNGLRGGVLSLLFIPILTFNLPFTDPTIRIIATRVSFYEVGKPVAVELFIQNNIYSPIKLHGHYNLQSAGERLSGVYESQLRIGVLEDWSFVAHTETRPNYMIVCAKYPECAADLRRK